MSRRHFPVLLLSLAGMAPLAQAQDEGFGNEAKAWIDLQLSGSAASTVERPLPGEIADRTYDRYAESFTHKIPEKLDRTDFVESEGN